MALINYLDTTTLSEEEEDDWNCRMNVIGQNGNEGLHYRRECDKFDTPEECTSCIHNRDDTTHYDPVDKPMHYTQGGVECIEAIEAALSPSEFEGYCKGAAIKYIWREQHKGGSESIQKAIWYLNRLLDRRAD